MRRILENCPLEQRSDSRPFCTRSCLQGIVCYTAFGLRAVISEVFTNVKARLLRSEVRAIARVKLSLPTLPKAKLHYPQYNFTYEVNFTCPQGQA